ncbi:MAG: hypothetical protein HOQ09_09010 [Gemmatimonadaceae bacterium]|nr:hypothetical protein [Gemmatimonadaceae bacterium]
MSAPAQPSRCPDPRAASIPDDPELRAVEDQLGAWLAARSIDDGVEDEETRCLVRALVTRLHTLGCPPEMMLVHLKQVLTPLGLDEQPSPRRRPQVERLREALVLMAIEEYFGYRRPRGR